jgi:hypothetical protein
MRQTSPGVQGALPVAKADASVFGSEVYKGLGHLGAGLERFGITIEKYEGEKARIDLSERRQAFQDRVRDIEKYVRTNMNGKAAVFGVGNDGVGTNLYVEQQLKEAERLYFDGVNDKYLPVYQQDFQRMSNPVLNFANTWQIHQLGVAKQQQLEASLDSLNKLAMDPSVSEEDFQFRLNQVLNEDIRAFTPGGWDVEALKQKVGEEANMLRFKAQVGDAAASMNMEKLNRLGGAAMGGGRYGLALQFESGGRADAVNVEEGSYGPHQINNKNVDAFTEYVLGLTDDPEVKETVQRFRAAQSNEERAAIWKRNADVLSGFSEGYIEKTHYQPAYNSLPEDLRAAIDGDMGLQQALASTAIQHGPNGEKGASGIFQIAWQKSGGDKDKFLEALYAGRAVAYPPDAKRYASELKLLQGQQRYAELSPEKRKIWAEAKAGTEEKLAHQYYMRIMQQSDYLTAEDALRSDVRAGRVSGENALKVHKDMQAWNTFMTDKASKETIDNYNAGMDKLFNAWQSGNFDPVMLEDDSLNYRARAQAGTMFATSKEREQAQGSDTFQNVYLAADQAIKSGAIKNDYELMNFAGVADVLSWKAVMELRGRIKEESRDNGINYVESALPRISSATDRMAFKIIAYEALSAEGINPKSPDAKILINHLLEYNSAIGMNNYKSNLDSAVKYLRMGMVLDNRVIPAEEDYKNILAYYGHKDTEGNRYRLNAAIKTKNWMENKNLTFEQAWEMSAPENDWAGQGNITLNVGWRTNQYDKTVRDSSLGENLDPNLTVAVMYVSSGGDYNFTAPNGAKGIIPLRPASNDELQEQQAQIDGAMSMSWAEAGLPFVYLANKGEWSLSLRDPESNIRLGIKVLAGFYRSNNENIEAMFNDIFAYQGYEGEALQGKINQALEIYQKAGNARPEQPLFGYNSLQAEVRSEPVYGPYFYNGGVYQQ